MHKSHQKQILQSVDNGIDCQDGLPVLAQDVQADVALQIDVRMIDLRLAFHLGRFVWVVRADLKIDITTITSG